MVEAGEGFDADGLGDAVIGLCRAVKWQSHHAKLQRKRFRVLS